MQRKPGLYLIALGLLVAILVGPVHAGAKLLGPNVEVTNSSAGFHVDSPDVTATGSTVYAVWLDDRDSYDEQDVYFAKSTDGGATWGNNVSVSNGYDRYLGLEPPAIAVHPATGEIYAVWFNAWYDYQPPTYPRCVYMAASTDGGTSFTPWHLWGSNDYYDIVPNIAIDPASGDILVAVTDYVGTGAGEYNVYGLVWDYGSDQWRAQVINDVAGSADTPTYMGVAARGNVSYIAWEDARNGGTRIYGDRTADHGQTWGTDFAISPNGVAASYPHLALAPDGTLYAAYEANEEEVYLCRSTNQGQSWSTPIQVSSTGDDDLGRWDLAVDDNGAVVVLWAVGEWGDWGSSGLYLSTSINGGQTFTHLRVDDGGDINNQYSPAIAATGSGDNARAYMVWGDDRNAQDEIWSARAELDATPPTAPTNLQAVPGDTVVDLTWGSSTDRNGISGYYVIRAPTSGGTYSVLNPRLVTGTSYRDVGLTTGTYYYKILAVDGTGNLGPTSNEASAAVTAGTDLPVNGAIAYEVGNDIRLNDLPALGNDRVLAQGNYPQFTATGQRVYYSSGAAILSRALDGSDPQTYYSHADFHGEFAVARDDAGYLAWIEEEQYSQINPYAVWDTFEPHYGATGSTQFVDTFEFASDPSISAGRTWLAYTSLGAHAPHSPVVQYDHVALGLADLGSNTRLALHTDVHYQDPAFAPSGATLAFAAYHGNQYEIWKATVQADGSLAGLTQLTRSAGGIWSRAPAWSSDGNWLIFARGAPAGGAQPDDPALADPHLYIVRADGSSLRALNVSGAEPAWHGGGAGELNHHLYLPLVVNNH